MIANTNREIFKDYVKNGGEFIASPQIGAGAGFDTRLAGKTWMSRTTVEDTVNACSRFDMVPLYNFGIIDLASLTDTIKWEHIGTEYSNNNTRIQNRSRFKTPKGDLETITVEEELKGGVCIKPLITHEEELDILEYYLDAVLEVKDFSAVTNHVKNCRAIIGEEALDIQWAMQPYEMLCFPDTMNTVMLTYDRPEQFRRLMDKILRLDEYLLKAVALGGADFVFLGGPGSEMISPKFYEDYLVPYSKVVTDMAHQNGLLIYSHICSPIEPMLTMGYYNQMGIDLFETLSEAPVGNIRSIRDAFSKLDESICTRGNIGLDMLLNNTPDEIRSKSLDILQAAKDMGRKHILAASDYLFYDVTEENVHAMCKAVRDFNGLTD